MKGQFFTLDFLAAVVVVTAVIGGMLHFYEFNQKSFSRSVDFQSNSAESFAEYFVNYNLTPPVPPACWCGVMRSTTDTFYDNCTDMACMGSCRNVFSATRLSHYCLNATCPCDGASCALEVRTC